LNYKSITSKFISSDVIFIDIGCNQHLSHPTDHGGRPGYIVDRPSQIIQILKVVVDVKPIGASSKAEEAAAKRESDEKMALSN
jgi:hypothetical protein